MIINSPGRWLLLGPALLGLASCGKARAGENEAYQGVAELDDRRLGFEVSGRLIEVTVRENRNQKVTLLFDPGTGLDERVLSEQFRY